METVLIATAGMIRETQEAVESACRLASVSGVAWSRQPSGSWPDVSQPALVIGVLPFSSRRVPDDLTFTVTQGFPGLPMLLLCQEPLTRDLVILNDQQINLLAPPATPERLATYIKRHLAERGVRPGPLFGRQHTRMIRSAKWWAAGLSRHRYVRDFGEAVVFPWMRGNDQSTQLDAVVPAQPGEPTVEALTACAWRLAGAKDHAECHRGAPSWCLTAAALHADLGAGRCIVLGPAQGASAWVLSPLRVPSVYRVGGPEGAEMTVLSPNFGDLLVLLSAPGEGAWTEGVFDEYAPGSPLEAATQGGDVLLRYLQETLVQTAGDFAAVILEVL
jgi:hypothetical protein